MEEKFLEGKTILFLGSSVTYGSAAQGVSFADFLAERTGCTAYKEAVSGTTLVDDAPDSYLSRLRTVPLSQVDLVICQLSTNDAGQNKPLGSVSAGFALESFDSHTVAGALEYVLAYVRERWGCPVVFYTNPRYESPRYQAMTELLAEISRKWSAQVIDLWNDAAFNAISDEVRQMYMDDAIHPTRMGYEQWWTPYFTSWLRQYWNTKSES